tara:strand:- start:1273 stop:1494 length:222 start_codon:yes stop_codon:yes gene_type:complete
VSSGHLTSSALNLKQLSALSLNNNFSILSGFGYTNILLVGPEVTYVTKIPIAKDMIKTGILMNFIYIYNKVLL